MAFNLLGSIMFGVSAIASLLEPASGEPVSARLANAGTSLGGICFLIGALLLLPEAAAARAPGPRPRSRRSKPEGRYPVQIECVTRREVAAPVAASDEFGPRMRLSLPVDLAAADLGGASRRSVRVPRRTLRTPIRPGGAATKVSSEG